MFADDVTLFSSHPNKEVAEAAIQEAIMNVAEWSPCHKITLNTSKCEVAFFTNSSKEVVLRVALSSCNDGYKRASFEL